MYDVLMSGHCPYVCEWYNKHEAELRRKKKETKDYALRRGLRERPGAVHQPPPEFRFTASIGVQPCACAVYIHVSAHHNHWNTKRNTGCTRVQPALPSALRMHCLHGNAHHSRLHAKRNTVCTASTSTAVPLCACAVYMAMHTTIIETRNATQDAQPSRTFVPLCAYSMLYTWQ